MIKKILLMLAMLTSLTMAEQFDAGMQVQEDMAKAEDTRMCKLCIAKAKKYNENMRDDELAKATLDNYKRRIKMHCGHLTSAKKK